MKTIKFAKFIKAQNDTYKKALNEIRKGRKESHWMWFIFPQIKGLSTSPTGIYYAINDLEEAKEYLENPFLRKNLINICCALLYLKTNNPQKIFGYIDSYKLQASMTLFIEADPKCHVFRRVLDKYFDGKKHKQTLQILKTKEEK